MEVGYFYFKAKNFAGAESRFREALQTMPRNPEAIFRLAQSLDKLKKTDEARKDYQLYLALQPAGLFAEEASHALRRLEKKAVPDARKPH
jgi:Flp pilus assembly protein TadD